MKRHRLTLIGGPGGEVRVPAETLLEAVGAVLEGALRAVRFAVEGESVRPGTRPAWLDAVCGLEVTGLRSGSAVVEVDAPTLAEACPDRFGPGVQATQFGEPDQPLDGDLSAVDHFGRALASALIGDREHLQVDRPLLDTCIRLARSAGAVYEGVRLDGIAGLADPVVVRAADAPTIERLRDEAPGPNPVRVTGVLDTISASRTEVILRLSDGTPVPARLGKPEPEELRDLFARRVVVSGVARFRASGKLLSVDVEHIGPAREADAMWEKLPAPRPGPAAPVAPLVPQDGTTGVAAIFGTWPGDETDEELLAALKDVR